MRPLVPVSMSVLLLALAASPASAQDKAPLTPPVLVSAPPGDYPESARSEGIEGTVELALTIGPDGKVTGVEVVTSLGHGLDEAASAAARAFVFLPARRGETPIAARIRYSYRFTIEKTKPPPASPVVAAPPASPAPAAAQAPAPVPVDEPMEVSVRGKAPEREVTRRELSSEELRTMPGTNGDPLRSVAAMPGVARAPLVTELVVVRGSSPAGTGIFLDGAFFPRAFHFGGLSTVVPVEMLERVDYYPGNFPARYGRHDGGIIDLRTRVPDGDRLHALAQVDLVDARVFASGPVTDGVRLAVGARRSWLDAWIGPVLEGADIGARTVPRYHDGQAVLEIAPAQASSLRLGVFTSSDTYRLYMKNPVANEPVLGGGWSSAISFTRVQALYEGELGEGVRFSSMASVGPDLQREKIGSLVAETRIDFVSSRGELSIDAARWLTVRGGWDVLVGTYDATLRIPNIPVLGASDGPPISSQRLLTWKGSGTVSRPAAFVEARISPVKAWDLVPSVRVDHTEEFSSEWTVSPRANTRFAFSQGPLRTAVRGGLGLFYQPPDYNAVLPIFGTRDLRASRGVHSSIGIEQGLGEGTELSVEGFHKKLDGIPSHDPASGPVPTNANGASGRVVGLETLLKVRPAGRFSGWVSYTLSRSTRQDAPGAPTRLFDFDQTHVLTVLSSVSVGRGVTVGGRFRYASGTPYTPCLGGSYAADSGVYDCVSGERFGARLPAFHQLDLRVDKTWEFSRWKLTAYLDVQNVYNRTNPEGLIYSYDKSKLAYASGVPLLPILGVRGEL